MDVEEVKKVCKDRIGCRPFLSAYPYQGYVHDMYVCMDF